ncbi:DEKNAAC105273, partial [Brettanomyces naardenensis]
MARDRATFLAHRKGLQKTKFYCQVCERQCLDENGFKCHIQSESHIRKLHSKLSSVGDNARKLVDEYSKKFLTDFLGQLHRMHGEKSIGANRFYQEYIQDKDHIHLNSTRWNSLTRLVMYLKDTGRCDVVINDEELEDSDTAKFSIAYRGSSDSIVKRKEREKKKIMSSDKESSEKLLKEQIQRGSSRTAGNSEEKEKESETKPVVAFKPIGKIKLKLGSSGVL